jgi:glycerol-3-phosphate dehydrogenase
VSEAREIECDVVVIGGGVAALWSANALRADGRSVVVLSNSPIGEGQSLAAQGVIHGGLKYAVAGKLTDSSEALADMPARWLAAMKGEGQIDLRGAALLSDHQVMWSLPNVVSQVFGFFGSKAVRGRSAAIPREQYPEAFDSAEYRGRLFRIEEPVVDPVSTMEALFRGVEETTHQVDWGRTAHLVSGADGVEAIRLTPPDGPEATLRASRYVFAAGAGNRDLLTAIGRERPAMQLRPLHQLVIRKPDLPDFFSVCVGSGPKPPLVSTTHTDSEGRRLWYIGGDIAEKAGVERDEAAQIEEGKRQFARWMPWIDLAGAEWFTTRSTRAEPHTGSGDRPPGAFCRIDGNVLVTWPTKLALAPDLADQVIALCPGASSPGPTPLLPLPRPPLGKAPWDLP